MKNRILAIAGALLIVLMIIPQIGCAKNSSDPVSRDSYYFDTVCRISIYDMDDMSEEKAA